MRGVLFVVWSARCVSGLFFFVDVWRMDFMLVGLVVRRFVFVLEMLCSDSVRLIGLFFLFWLGFFMVMVFWFGSMRMW